MTSPTPIERSARHEHLRPWLQAAVGVGLFAAATWVLHRSLHEVHYRDVVEAVRALPAGHLVRGVLLTALSYLVLTGYDYLAIRHVGKQIGFTRIATVSFVSYAIANTAGLPLLSGSAVRYRFYSRWGLDAADLSRVVVFYTSTLWLGLLALGGAILLVAPPPTLVSAAPEALLRGLGALLVGIVPAYVALAALRRRPLTVRGFDIAVPGPRVALAQVLLSLADWILAAAVFAVLLPAGGPGLAVVIGAFLAAQVAGLLSHVPGGLGVFESAILVTLGGFIPPEQLVGSLVLYRVVYYLLPLAGALGILILDEVHQRRRAIARVGALVGSLSAQLAPRVLALFTFIAGVVLLVSGALPSDPARLRTLSGLLPLGVFEASHFLGSIVGVALLFVAQGIARRLDVTYYLAVGGLAVAIVLSLLRTDFDQALLLVLLLLAFLPARHEFDRRAALLDAPFAPGWTLAAVAAIGGSIWLGFFAYRHVAYSDQLWWRFALDADAPRFLRASVGATVALLAFGVARLIRPARPEVPELTEQDLLDAGRIIANQGSILPYLVYLRDKGVLFDETRTAFLMYAVQGSTWVSLGGPVGPASAAPGLIRQFLEAADDFGGTPVFYQIASTSLAIYAEFGLTFVKLGEEARVPLAAFSLEGKPYKDQRSAINRLAREGGEFLLVSPEDVPGILGELGEVSADWLAHREASEKGFSLGFFEPSYVARFPVGVIRVAGRIEAFASVWLGPDHQEMCVDLMRFRRTAPSGTMDALFGKLMIWGKEQGYAWFTLGMAPLSGLEGNPLARTWPRLGHWVFRHGGALYNFQGLREFKEKFHPQWEPRYLAYPGGLGLPRLLADIAALVAGGYRGIFR